VIRCSDAWNTDDKIPPINRSLRCCVGNRRDFYLQTTHHRRRELQNQRLLQHVRRPLEVPQQQRQNLLHNRGEIDAKSLQNFALLHVLHETGH